MRRSRRFDQIVGLVAGAALVAACSSPREPTGSPVPSSPASSSPASSSPAPSSTVPETVEAVDDVITEAVGPVTRWAAHLSGPTNQDEIDGIAAAPDGSLYVTGKFVRSATIGGTDLVSAGLADIPFARFDAAGEPIWVTSFGSVGEDNFFDVDADESGAIATGIFEGAVRFGEFTLVSAGAVDCAVVAVAPDGRVRWARSFGGPGVDGCNEVSIGPDQSIVTSIDTDGGWELDGSDIPETRLSDTVLLRLDNDGEVDWARRLGGDGPQRGKSISVAPDGSVAFGGETLGALEIGDVIVEVPGSGFDAWLTRWTADGGLEWSVTWGGAGRDLAKGVLHDDAGVFAVGPFDGRIDLLGASFDADRTTDLLVARFELDGQLAWATSVSGDGPLTGAEVTSSSAGGLLVGSTQPDGLELRDATGVQVSLDDSSGGTAWLATYRTDGSIGWASTIPGAITARPGEIARVGGRLYLDMTVRDAMNSAGGVTIVAERKDAAVYAIDVPD